MSCRISMLREAHEILITGKRAPETTGSKRRSIPRNGASGSFK